MSGDALPAPAIALHGVTKRFGRITALAAVDARFHAGRLTGLVGPDGSGKTTLMRLMAGLLRPTDGRIEIAGRDTRRHADEIHTLIGYMPQRFGLYEDLTVAENLELYAKLKRLRGAERRHAFDAALAFTRLGPFTGRLAGRLSGGMKQKLGLACALLARPAVLLLDEPSVGVDPVSRRDLWQIVRRLAEDGMAIVWSTAYLDEAERCDDVLLLNDGRVWFAGRPDVLRDRVAARSFRIQGAAGDRRALLAQALDDPRVRDGVIQGDAVRIVVAAAGDDARADAAAVADLERLTTAAGGRLAPVAPRFEDAFIDLLGGGPGGRSRLAERVEPVELGTEIAVSCRGLTKRFGSFTAADHVTFDVRQGEIFGLLGPNGAGKSTTFKMLCGLLKPTSGTAEVVGHDLARAGAAAKQRVGYMAQKFSLYGLLSVRQNLEFFAGIYQLAGRVRRERIDEMIETFELERYLSSSPNDLPLGFKQRLALACALMHRPAVLFLDEPTSGVDPITRREFWTHINGLVRKGVTIMVTTHFMDEAEYCDRVAMIDRARLIAVAPPDELKARAASPDLPSPTMEDAFIAMVDAHARAEERAA
ncbi:MAG TPA: ATP-binding cassette domain-containing protein [Gammaproteobacteria bacterium]